ncbi:MAG: hypothetical protein V9G98_26845 [Candidatus Competibacter sp.]
MSLGSAVPASALASVPAALQPWVDWVLYDQQDRRCPVNYDAVDRRQCVWPSALQLALDARGGQFDQQVYADRESWLILPGDRRHWPQEVRLDALLVPVLERDGRPAIKAPTGAHQIGGRFIWQALPDSIRVPTQNALLELRIDNRPAAVSRIESDGILWLRQRPTELAQQDDLDLQVFRLLTDGIPFEVETRLELRVSGQAREEMLGPVLLPDFLPLALNSPLPARLEPDGRLRVQLRPGSWTINLTARHRGPVDALARPAIETPWPEQEIWSFRAQNALRVVQVSGAPALDPAQTRLPEAWRQWPAYLVQPGEALRFATRTRGDTESIPGEPDPGSHALAGFRRRRLHRAGPAERQSEPNAAGRCARAQIGSRGDQRRGPIYHPIIGCRGDGSGSATVERSATGRRQPVGTRRRQRSADGRLARRAATRQRHAQSATRLAAAGGNRPRQHRQCVVVLLELARSVRGAGHRVRFRQIVGLALGDRGTARHGADLPRTQRAAVRLAQHIGGGRAAARVAAGAGFAF